MKTQSKPYKELVKQLVKQISNKEIQIQKVSDRKLLSFQPDLSCDWLKDEQFRYFLNVDVLFEFGFNISRRMKKM